MPRKAKNRLKPTVDPSVHMGQPLCSAPRDKGGCYPCMKPAIAVVRPGTDESQHLCAGHHAAFVAYYDQPEDRPIVKVIQ